MTQDSKGRPSKGDLSRVEEVYRQLRRGIIDGDFPPGAPLRVPDLSEEFGVSLIPIREALRKLEVERLLENIPNKGARVAEVSTGDLIDLYDTRKVLEEAALRRAWPRLDEDLIDHLRTLCDQMVDMVRTGREAYDLHRQIHFGIYERSGSGWLVYLIEFLWNHTERYRRMAAQLQPFIDVGHELHREVVEAAAGGDLEAAIAALHRDLERTAVLVLEATSNDG